MIILHVDSSIGGAESITRQISLAVVDRLRELNPHAGVARRDLADKPLGHIELADLADSTVVDEFLGADVVVIGAPMYNFSVSSSLKAWLDRVAIVGKTFRYEDGAGPIGMSGGRRVIIASSRGGLYGPGTPLAAFDHQEAYLRHFFAFLGITDVEVLTAEGVAYPPQREAAVARAIEAAKDLAA